MMTFEQIETERLILKKLTPEVFTYVFRNYSDEDIKKQLGLRSQEELIKEKEKSQGGYTTHDRTILSFMLVLKSNEEIIGRCEYHNWYKNHSRAELGYVLHKDEHKGKGYMSEAVEAILNYGFDTMNLNRVEACTSTTNTASQKIIQKYGFIREGHLRQHYVLGEEILDSVIFSLLKEEYKAFKKTTTAG